MPQPWTEEGVLRLVVSVKWSRRIDMSLYQQSIFLVPKNFASTYNFFMKIRNSFVEKFHTVTAVSRVREVGDSELSNICGQQSSVSLLCIVCSCAQAAAAVKLFSRKKISYMNDISFWPAALTLLVTTTELPTYVLPCATEPSRDAAVLLRLS